MKKYLILVILLGFFVQPVFSQGGRGNRKQRIEEFRKKFIEETLGLSGSDADAFWDVYKDYEEERKEIKKEMRQLKAGFNALSDSQLEGAIQRFFTLKEQELAIDQKYFKKLQTVLTIRQIAVLYQAENKIKQEILKRLRQMQEERNGG